MFDSDNIEGIDILRKTLPENLQFWNKFGRISEFHYDHIYDEVNNEYKGRITVTLSDDSGDYEIRLKLINVSGRIGFDTVNGFHSGFTIDDCSGSGYENKYRFHIYSIEQDIDFELYCENIKAEMV